MCGPCRDCYEAFTLYNFLALCLASIGGASQLVDLWAEEERQFPAGWLTATCCLAKAPLNGPFLRHTVQGVLQFVLVKVVTSLSSFGLELLGAFHEGAWTPRYGFFWTVVIYNISIRHVSCNAGGVICAVVARLLPSSEGEHYPQCDGCRETLRR